MIILSSCNTLLKQLMGTLNCKFVMKDMDPLQYFLGIEVSIFFGHWSSFLSSVLFLSQASYATIIHDHANISSYKPIQTPMGIRSRSHIAIKHFYDSTVYQRSVGAFQYPALTWPNITYALNFAWQFMHNQIVDHFHISKSNLYCISMW